MTLDEVFHQLSTLETARLRIRPLQIIDSEAMYEIKSNPEATAKYGQQPDKSLEDTRVWVERRLEDYEKREDVYWVFTLKENDRVIGGCCFWNFDPTSSCAEIGYELHPAYWNMGITSEALLVVVTYGFIEMELHRIEGLPMVSNEPSVKVLQKLGFNRKGTIHERIFFRGN